MTIESQDPIDTAPPKPSVVWSLLAIIHIGLSIVAMLAAERGDEWAVFLLYVLIYSHISLATLWAGFGRARTALRWMALLGTIGFWWYVVSSPYEDRTDILGMFVWHAALGLLAAVFLASIGVRLVSGRPVIRSTTANDNFDADVIGRLRLSQIFTITTAVAMMATIAGMRGMSIWNLWLAFLDRGPYAGIAIASAWAVLAPGHWLWRVLLTICCASFVGGGHLAWIGAEVWFWMYFAALFSAHSLAVCASLGAIRACGYRLIILDTKI